ncbi:hypothetical protein BD289DRAFT_62340 [Coniella lustricola]|uniref:Uncharacterized protein n=1 Tax=Coniella lustricola TaxID=2025994 RepID=A0A2T3A0F6_9PEZI|nr:hypothetical protein BD289DRAFT_62340 [Coniella lustricola]
MVLSAPSSGPPLVRQVDLHSWFECHLRDTCFRQIVPGALVYGLMLWGPCITTLGCLSSIPCASVCRAVSVRSFPAGTVDGGWSLFWLLLGAGDYASSRGGAESTYGLSGFVRTIRSCTRRCGYRGPVSNAAVLSSGSVTAPSVYKHVHVHVHLTLTLCFTSRWDYSTATSD